MHAENRIIMEDKIILQVVADQKDEISTYRTEQWVRRKEEISFEFDSPLAQVVIGVRRSGKSTLCHKVLLENNIRYAYVNLDDDRLAGMQTSDLNTLLLCVYQIYGTDISYLFLDEIQNVEGWHLFVNRLLRIGIHVFVTGSNAKLLSGELATHLTGRYNEIRLYPFSFSEYCNLTQTDIHSITTKAEAERKRAFADYINDGGFPELQFVSNKRIYVQSLVDAVLQKDIQQRFHIRNTDALRKIAYHLVSNPCQLVNFDELSHILNVSDKTIHKYIDYLQQAFLIQLLPKFSFKSKERITGQKAYLVDTCFENNRDYSMSEANIGWRLENVVYIELLRRCARKFFDIYYYKPTSRAKEVDFVVCDRNHPEELIQVSYDIEHPKTFKRETASLIKAANELNCSKLKIITFSHSNQIEMEGKTIQILSAIDWLTQEE